MKRFTLECSGRVEYVSTEVLDPKYISAGIESIKVAYIMPTDIYCTTPESRILEIAKIGIGDARVLRFRNPFIRFTNRSSAAALIPENFRYVFKGSPSIDLKPSLSDPEAVSTGRFEMVTFYDSPIPVFVTDPIPLVVEIGNPSDNDYQRSMVEVVFRIHLSHSDFESIQNYGEVVFRMMDHVHNLEIEAHTLFSEISNDQGQSIDLNELTWRIDRSMSFTISKNIF